MTQLEISNRALAVIGHDRTIASTSETSTEATLCAMFYPAARDNVLAACDWEFAAVDSSVTLDSDPKNWAIPAGCVKVVSVTDSSGNVVRSVRRGANLVIYGNGLASATVRYTSNAITGFNDALPHLVAEAIVYELASLLFGPMIGNVQDGNGAALFQSYVQMAASKLQTAIAAEDAEHLFMGGSRNAQDEKRTEIVNRAIARLGGSLVVTDFATDPSPVAARARLLFPSSLNRVLRIRDWDFATTERTLSLASLDPNGYSRFSLPDDCVRIVRVTDDELHPVDTMRDRDFLQVKTGGRRTVIRYVSNDFDLSAATDEFLELISVDLAEKLAPSVLDDAKAAAAVSQEMRILFGEIDRTEANETASFGQAENPFIAARR